MVQINITKKYGYFFVGLIVIVGLGFVLAQVIPNPGHSYSQLETCPNQNEILKSDGSAWTCGADVDTQLSQSQVRAYIDAEYPALDTNYNDDFDGAWNSLSGVPAGFIDGVDDVGVGDMIASSYDPDLDYKVNSADSADFAITAGSANSVLCSAISGGNDPDYCTDAAGGHGDGSDCASGQAARGVDASGNAELCWTPPGGDITGVTAGTGLSGGGSSGVVTLDADCNAILGHACGYDNVGGSGLRIIRGSVRDDGTILYGSGFTSTKFATGEYSITFDTSFPSPVSAVVSPQSTMRTYSAVSMVSGNSFNVIFFDQNGNKINKWFHFIVAGPE